MGPRQMTPFLKSIFLVFNLCIKLGSAYNPNYSYQVNIEDPAQANFQQKGETRLGEKAEGFYSVLDPDGRLRTVTYVSDEYGFRPTVTYSYPKVLSHGNLLPATPVFKQPLPVLAAGAAPLLQVFKAMTEYPQPLQYAASYGTPVFTVNDARHFYKTAPPLPPLPVATHVFQSPPVLKQVIQTQPPPVVAIQTVPQPSGYNYPIPEVKLEYPPPPPPPPPATLAPPVLIEKEKSPLPSGGYTYPVPEIKLDYPLGGKIEIPAPVVVPERVVQAVPPKAEVVPLEPLGIAPLPQRIQPVVPQPIPAPLPQPIPAVLAQPIPAPLPQPIQTTLVPAEPPRTFRYQFVGQYGNKISQVQPQPQILSPVPPPPQPQVLVSHQPVIAPQPQIHYTQNPAQVFHRQLHFPRVHNVAQQVVQAVAPAPPPPAATFIHHLPPPSNPLVELKYEDIVGQNPNLMRYGTAPVDSYLPPLTQVEKVVSPVGLVPKRPGNPLTFNYGYDNGVSKVSHSYYGSGW